ncbi:hypothetical protein MMC08_008665 [Hypocenomyce scalaris]|nr:hypothetical protein [Hypocenomyce scalaris]
MDDYLDVKNSTELGQFFMKTIYVNLVIETKLYIDVVKSDESIADVRKKLLNFYDCLPLADDFKKVDKSDFKEIQLHFQDQCKGQKLSDISDLAQFRSSGAPPKKISDGNSLIL